MIADKLLSRLDKVKSGKNNSWIACCPAHDDKNPSLTITEIEDRVLIKCWSGCDTYEICESVGLDISDLFPERTASSKPIKAEKRYNPAHVLEALLSEIFVIDLYGDLLKSPEDNMVAILSGTNRVKLAFERIKAAKVCVNKIRIEA